MVITFALDKELEDKKPLIVSGMKILLNEQSLKVRAAFGYWNYKFLGSFIIWSSCYYNGTSSLP